MIDFFFNSVLSETNLSTALFGYFMQIFGMFEDLKSCIWCLVFVGIWYAYGKLIVKYFIVMYMMCVLNSTRKRTNRLQYSVCKCEVDSTGKWSNIGILFNQPHFNLVPKV
jgi:hypothetical protein